MRFSQRNGIVPVRNVIQKDSMDGRLRNSLWNALYIYYWRLVSNGTSGHDHRIAYPLFPREKDFKTNKIEERESQDHTINRSWTDRESKVFFEKLWIDYFKRPIDELPSGWKLNSSGRTIHQELHLYFFACEWYEVYDFIEAVPVAYSLSRGENTSNRRFRVYCNGILERELSAYRFVGEKISEITSEEEIQSIEEALEPSDKFHSTAYQLKRALELFSDRSNPDYRNSMKESISAVEAMCKIVTGDEKATLEKAIKKIEGIHPALQSGFRKIYGYTSDADGIRHALLEEETLRSEDAKFMLVACSAFINYLKAKYSV